MQEKELLLEAEKKEIENAMKCFPKFFGKNYFGPDFKILDTKSFEDIREEYLKYCEEYVAKIGNISEAEQEKMLMIKRAYHYMSAMLLKRKNTYFNKSIITKKVLDAYKDLRSQIGMYYFRTHDYYTWGAMQNLTVSKNIEEITLLEPMLIMVLKNIDSYFATIPYITEVNCFDNQLMEELEKLIKELRIAATKLYSVRIEYHDKWNIVNNRRACEEDVTVSDLGKAKAKWKAEKNEACRTILNFYGKIKNIDILLESDRVHSLEEINEVYSKGLVNIVSGPNYYCYLNKEEQKKLTEENKAKKAKLKNKEIKCS